MRFDYTQIFLLVWIVAFWSYYFLTYGKVEEKHERTTNEKYDIKAKWGPFFGLAFLGWSMVILIYFFHYDSIDWVWKLSFLDCTPVKLLAIIMMCVAFLLNILFTMSVGKSIQDAFALDEDPRLITSGCRRKFLDHSQFHYNGLDDLHLCGYLWSYIGRRREAAEDIRRSICAISE